MLLEMGQRARVPSREEKRKGERERWERATRENYSKGKTDYSISTRVNSWVQVHVCMRVLIRVRFLLLETV